MNLTLSFKRTSNRKIWAIPMLAILSVGTRAMAVPILSLTSSGGLATSATIAQGTPLFSIDLRFNSDGHPLSTLQYYLNKEVQSTGQSALKYGGNVVSIINPPLQGSDLFLPPDAGSTLSAPTSTNYSDTWLYHAGADYPQINGAIATYTLDTASLLAGDYIITPIKTDYSFGGQPSNLSFGVPGSFTLTVATPEPAFLGMISVLAAGLLARRRRSVAMQG